MELRDKTIVVTGAANGIGRALCTTFAAQGAKAIVCVDRDASALTSVTNEINGFSFTVDVSHEDEIARMIEDVEDRIGPIDLFCSNAGVYAPGGAEAADDDWQRLWDVNVMAHVWAARHVVPRMVARGGGYLLNTASAAGLLNQIGAAPYGVTKHAAVGLAEWLAMTHGDDGIKVSVLCPQAVRTAMIEGFEDGVAAIDGLLEPNQIADACVEAIRAETFLVLPHPGVLDYMRHKAADYDRWIGGMRKLNRVYSN
ncbi:MAG: SDR family NAD(P)-dependent oxidoreductase [Tateyamaria sp.]|uniref:SDR family oxidoreductase n=1 Tax=Tateyamaria sp. TaxID=1929288 RepID=UPI0032A03248